MNQSSISLIGIFIHLAALELCNAAINYLSSGIDKKALTFAASKKTKICSNFNKGMTADLFRQSSIGL